MKETLNTRDQKKLERKFKRVRKNYLRDLERIRRRYMSSLASVVLEYGKLTVS